MKAAYTTCLAQQRPTRWTAYLRALVLGSDPVRARMARLVQTLGASGPAEGLRVALQRRKKGLARAAEHERMVATIETLKKEMPKQRALEEL